jgi:hypothetical protein
MIGRGRNGAGFHHDVRDFFYDCKIVFLIRNF